MYRELSSRKETENSHTIEGAIDPETAKKVEEEKVHAVDSLIEKFKGSTSGKNRRFKDGEKANFDTMFEESQQESQPKVPNPRVDLPEMREAITESTRGYFRGAFPRVFQQGV